MLVGREVSHQKKELLINEIDFETHNNSENNSKNESKLENCQSNNLQPTTVYIVEKSTLNAINKRAAKVFNVF